MNITSEKQINPSENSFGTSIDLSGDAKIPNNLVASKKEEGPLNVSATVFANPKHNVHRLGFSEGMKVADFGSGSGAYALELVKLVGPSGEVYAVDVQKDLLTRTQNSAVSGGYENLKIIWGDIDEPGGVGIKDGLLDGVLISNTLFQTENKNEAIRQAWRVLKPNGILTIIDWSESFGGLGPKKNDVITKSEAIMICTDNKFLFKREFNAGEHHYGISFNKTDFGSRNANVRYNNEINKEQINNRFVEKTLEQEIV